MKHDEALRRNDESIYNKALFTEVWSQRAVYQDKISTLIPKQTENKTPQSQLNVVLC